LRRAQKKNKNGEFMKQKCVLLSLLFALLTAACLPQITWGQGEPQRIEISAKRFQFTPGDITVKKGQPVVLVLHSEDVEHGLSIREFGINAHIVPGKTLEVRFTPARTGDFVGHCIVFCGPGHGSMQIKIHVVA
jgi:cytochrome c oxidase subunit II